jgi:hypothetical protein
MECDLTSHEEKIKEELERLRAADNTILILLALDARNLWTALIRATAAIDLDGGGLRDAINLMSDVVETLDEEIKANKRPVGYDEIAAAIEEEMAAFAVNRVKNEGQ